MTPLRQRLIDDLRIRNRSPRTIEAYVRHVARFARYFGRSPEVLGPEEVRRYQLHLLERKASWSAFNQCVSGLRFLYGVTLGRPEEVPRIPYGRRPKRVPRKLTQAEVLELLQCVRCHRDRVVLTTIYATGQQAATGSAVAAAAGGAAGVVAGASQPAMAVPRQPGGLQRSGAVQPGPRDAVYAPDVPTGARRTRGTLLSRPQSFEAARGKLDPPAEVVDGVLASGSDFVGFSHPVVDDTPTAAFRRVAATRSAVDAALEGFLAEPGV